MTSEVLLIEPDQLSAEALQGLVEAFIVREGTDYGEIEYSMADKVAQVYGELRRGFARIAFDPLTETCTIMTRDELSRLSR